MKPHCPLPEANPQKKSTLYLLESSLMTSHLGSTAESSHSKWSLEWACLDSGLSRSRPDSRLTVGCLGLTSSPFKCVCVAFRPSTDPISPGSSVSPNTLRQARDHLPSSSMAVRP